MTDMKRNTKIEPASGYTVMIIDSENISNKVIHQGVANHIKK